MNAPQRYIAHLDLDSFFVSVEILNNPSLKGKPVIVGGSADRGVVTTCSYEARKFGVRSAMPMKKAMQLCPHAILVKGTRGEYSRYSKWVTNIIAAKAPLFEKASIDEFYIDLTGMDKFFNVVEWIQALRAEIISTTQLPISCGLASNKLVAKIATDEAKPNGLLFIQPGKEAEFLAPLPIEKMPGIGKHEAAVLHGLGIVNLGDIAAFNPQQLEKILGDWGKQLWHRAQGIHHGAVHSYHEAKSISTERTLVENIDHVPTLLKLLVEMTERVAYELRADGKMTTCVAVKIRYPNFETTSKQMLIAPTQADDELIPAVKTLFHQLYKKGQPVRLIGVRLSNFILPSTQTNLFSDTQKKSDLYAAIDAVKNMFGKDFLKRGSTQ